METDWLEDDNWEDAMDLTYSEEKIQKFHHFGVRYDYASSKTVYEQRLLHLLLHPRHSRIYFMTFRLFWKAVFSKKTRAILEDASLILLQSRLLAWGIKVLSGMKIPTWAYANVYDALVSFRDRFSLSVYVWGGSTEDVRVILKQFSYQSNVQGSFLGGHQSVEASDAGGLDYVLTSLAKLSPNFLLLGEGFDFDFAYEHQKRLPANVTLFSPPMFSLMASQRSFDRTPSFLKNFARGFFNFLRNPFLAFSWAKGVIYILMLLTAKVLGYRY